MALFNVGDGSLRAHMLNVVVSVCSSLFEIRSLSAIYDLCSLLDASLAYYNFVSLDTLLEVL